MSEFEKGFSMFNGLMASFLTRISEQELDCFMEGKLSDLLLLKISCLIDDSRENYE